MPQYGADAGCDVPCNPRIGRRNVVWDVVWGNVEWVMGSVRLGCSGIIPGRDDSPSRAPGEDFCPGGPGPVEAQHGPGMEPHEKGEG